MGKGMMEDEENRVIRKEWEGVEGVMRNKNREEDQYKNDKIWF